MAESEAVDQAARELYALPPGEFTRARDARATELRSDGDRDAATAVKALRRPTVAAWALNQLARTRAKDVKRLLEAGERLRSAQEDLLGGGARTAFQKAATAERDLVADLTADATTLATEAGERAGGLREKVAETLHAAALDEDTAEELRAGRLTREREAIGGFGAPGGGPAPPSPPKKTRKASPPSPKGSDTESESRKRLAAAKTDERHARRELEAAEKAVRNAQERAEAARVHAEEAAQRSKTTADRLKEAKKAETVARRAHTRAAKALEGAERGS